MISPCSANRLIHDIALYDADCAFVRTGLPEDFAAASDLFARQMKGWRVYTQHIGPILQAAGTSAT